MRIRGEVSAPGRAGGGAPAPVKKRLRPYRAEDMRIRGEVSASGRAGGGAPAPVKTCRCCPVPGIQVLLYDGTCAFCAESVQTVLRHDRRGTLKFAPLHGVFAASVRARHPELESIDSMVWVDLAPGGSEQVLVRSAAALRVARY